MSKTLKCKLANLALCCTVVVSHAGPTLAYEADYKIETVTQIEVTSEQDTVQEATETDTETEKIEAGVEINTETEIEIEAGVEVEAEIGIEVEAGVETEIEGPTDLGEEEVLEGIHPGISLLPELEGQPLPEEVSELPVIDSNMEQEEVVVATDAKIKVLQADETKLSAARLFIQQENLTVTKRGDTFYLPVAFNADGSKVLQWMNQKIDGQAQALTIHEQGDGTKYVEVALEDLQQSVVVEAKLALFAQPMEFVVRVVEDVSLQVNSTNTTISIGASGGLGKYQYTIDGGKEWHESNIFEGLKAGEYAVAVRDAIDIAEVSETQIVTLAGTFGNGLEVGTYQVDLNVLKATSNEPSHAASFMNTKGVALEVKEDGKAYATIQVTKDPLNMTNALVNVEQKIGDGYETLPLAYTEEEAIRYVETQVVFAHSTEVIDVQCGVKMGENVHSTPFRIALAPLDIEGGEEEVAPVTIQVSTSVDCITVNATGGNGTYEYTIGEAWVMNNQFTGLAAGTYTVQARDRTAPDNVSEPKVVAIEGKKEESEIGLADGEYSVSIRVLEEASDKDSMATDFFKKEALPLRIVDGEAILTIQVAKDGMGMTNVIDSLEQRIGGSYHNLTLNYLNDSSKRYVTAEVVLGSLQEDAYIRCGINAVPFSPILRIQLIESSITEGLGRIDDSFVETMIAQVAAENGTVTITMNQEDESLSQYRFSAMLYKEGETKGEKLTLQNYQREGEKVSFTFEAIEAEEYNQNYTVGITFGETETLSNVFMVEGEHGEKAQTLLKENVLAIKYINGYEDGTFRPDKTVSRAEALQMLAALVAVPEVSGDYQLATIDVLQIGKDQPSLAKQFFMLEGIKVLPVEEGYYIELVIANEGMGFKNIIESVEHQVGSTYQEMEVIKSADAKIAKVGITVANLEEDIVLRTGIAPMGGVKPELRICIVDLVEGTFESDFTDIEMWAKDAIMSFEKLGVLVADETGLFRPKEEITVGEVLEILAKVMGHAVEEVVEESIENTLTEVKMLEETRVALEKTITRAALVTLINNTIGHSEETNVEAISPFSDLTPEHWAYKEIIKITHLPEQEQVDEMITDV